LATQESSHPHLSRRESQFPTPTHPNARHGLGQKKNIKLLDKQQHLQTWPLRLLILSLSARG